MIGKKGLLIGAVLIVGFVSYRGYQHFTESRGIREYTTALEELAKVIEENASKPQPQQDTQRLRAALDRCQKSGAGFAKIPPGQQPKFLLNYPDLERALQRVNRAMDDRSGNAHSGITLTSYRP